MEFPTLIVTWIALVVAYLGVTSYRWFLTRREDDVVHVRDSEANLIPAQVSLAHRVHKLDLWSRVLIVTVVVYGLIIAAFYMYRQFVDSSRFPAS